VLQMFAADARRHTLTATAPGVNQRFRSDLRTVFCLTIRGCRY
jgi:hypothetical protein